MTRNSAVLQRTDDVKQPSDGACVGRSHQSEPYCRPVGSGTWNRWLIFTPMVNVFVSMSTTSVLYQLQSCVVHSVIMRCRLCCQIQTTSVLNAAVHLVTGTRSFDHGLSHLLHEELHWLDVRQRILYKLGVTVHCCLQYKAPEYLVNFCTPVSDIHSRRHLRSATPTSPDHTTLPAEYFRSSRLLCQNICLLSTSVH